VRSFAVALLLGLCLAVAGCGGGGSEATTVSGPYRYPTRVIDSFMRSCTQGEPARNSLCACVIDKLSYSVSNRDFARVLVGREVARVKKATRRAVAVCA
jgi:hypothetical protein